MQDTSVLFPHPQQPQAPAAPAQPQLPPGGQQYPTGPTPLMGQNGSTILPQPVHAVLSGNAR